MNWKKIRRYNEPAAWVRRVAWNLATNRLRRQGFVRNFLRQQRPVHVEGPNPNRVALAAALKTLPPQQRRAVVMHYMGQLSIAEIAELEGAPEGTVKSWLSRGRTALAAQLADTTKGY